jgi:hypothetical protein
LNRLQISFLFSFFSVNFELWLEIEVESMHS